MEILELQIFQNKQWLIGFIIISIVGSVSRTMFNWRFTPKEVTIKNTLFNVFFGLAVCFFGEIALATFGFAKYRIFLILASFSSEKILAKLVKDESKNIDTIFNKTNKLTDNEK